MSPSGAYKIRFRNVGSHPSFCFSLHFLSSSPWILSFIFYPASSYCCVLNKWQSMNSNPGHLIKEPPSWQVIFSKNGSFNIYFILYLFLTAFYDAFPSSSWESVFLTLKLSERKVRKSTNVKFDCRRD